VTVVPRSCVQGPGALLGTGTALPEGARVLRLADPEAVHCISIVYDSKRLSSAANAFLDVVDRHIRND
jgi:hypothetical protein